MKFSGTCAQIVATAWLCMPYSAISSPALSTAGLRSKHITLSVEPADADAEPAFGVPSLQSVLGGKGGTNRQPRRSSKPTPQGDNSTAPVCGETQQINSASDKWARCPDKCPLWVETEDNNLWCDFKCVPATVSDCQASRSNHPVPDEKMGICRRCVVGNCRECSDDGTETCIECRGGYRLKDGKCESKYIVVWYGFLCFLAVVFSLIVTWLVMILMRPVSNKAGLDVALRARTSAKLLKREDGESSRQMWPLMTNLCSEDVGGPGLTLHFNFQAVLVFWGLVVAAAWYIMAVNIDEELLILGRRRGITPRQQCIVIAYGYEQQKSLMWTKVGFTSWMYAISFLLCILHSIRQLRMFQALDEKTSSHKDYCAILRGLPEIPGNNRVEEELVEILQGTQTSVVGVSVVWNIEEKSEDVFTFIQNKTMELEKKQGHHGATVTGSDSNAPAQERSGLDQMFYDLESEKYLKAEEQKAITEGKVEDGQECEHVRDLVKNVVTSDRAFVVFETEKDRDYAVNAVREEGLVYTLRKEGEQDERFPITLEEATCEPKTVCWNKSLPSNKWRMVFNFIKGLGMIFLGLLFWAVVFYMPYAYVVMSFNYSNGEEPSAMVGLAFSMVVVVGNAIMYLICSAVAEQIGFFFSDDQEACYMMLYTFACTLNVLLDLFTTYFVAYSMMVGMKMRTYHGVPLKDVDMFPDAFETYAMQKALGEQLWAYSFPATFFIPFVIEPFATIVLPYYIGKILVQTHPDLTTLEAEQNMAAAPMDLGRYGDLMLNVMLAALCLWFPGGFMVQMYVALAFSHVFIYAFDHYRVLRTIPACEYANMTVDWWCQWLFCIPLGLLLACAYYKNWCAPGSDHKNPGLTFLKCFALLICHIIVHTIVLLYVVPLFGRKNMDDAPERYEQVARKKAASFFNTNPIHCLRSEYYYEHKDKEGKLAPQYYCMLGHEHVMIKNEKIGAFFEDVAMEGESFEVDIGATMRQGYASIGKGFAHFSSKFKSSETKKTDDANQTPIAKNP